MSFDHSGRAYRRPQTSLGIRPRKILPEPSPEFKAARAYLGQLQTSSNTYQIKRLAAVIAEKGLNVREVVGTDPLTFERASHLIKLLG